jgi:CubicO group peptidase (beta-lactamase class C family)
MSNRTAHKKARIWLVAGMAAALAACATSGEGAPAADKGAWPTKADVAPTQTAFTPEGLAALDARVKEAVDKGEVAGVSHILIKDGQVALFNMYGAQAYGGPPITENTLFRIRSMTKPVTGVAMMQLYEKGLWKPEDPITKFLPEMANLKVAVGENPDGTIKTEPAKRAPTMHELMTHTAGFGYGLSAASAVDREFIKNHPMAQKDLDALVRRTAEIPLLFNPGERWSYSIAVDLQGAIVERLSGMPFGEYLEKNIFAPLAMTDTGFLVAEADKGRFATVYQLNAQTKAFEPFPDAYSFFVQDHAESGGGGLVSTTHDYARFAQMLLNEGELDGARILKPETIAVMMKNQIGDMPGVFTGGGFGYGGAVVTKPPTERNPSPIGSWSWFGIDGTWFWVDPTNELAYVGMIQRRGNAGQGAVNLRGETPALVYKALAK